MVLMVLFSTAVIKAWHGLFQSYLSSSDPSYVFAVQIGFSALLCSSAILTLESISPISILSQWWQQHVTKIACSVVFLNYYYYIYFFCFASQEYISLRDSFSFCFVFLFLKLGTCEHVSHCSSQYADTMYLLSFRLSQCQ